MQRFQENATPATVSRLMLTYVGANVLGWVSAAPFAVGCDSRCRALSARVVLCQEVLVSSWLSARKLKVCTHACRTRCPMLTSRMAK